ncbi:MAG TPA: glycosyltransferase [Cyanobacteria bacterium UBA8803]|nr:glycosyltransferase [Cyanobacteria bacterium UBA9273]HBL59481.1 glycosyltransferase [Cyanobacteria bacterium UBA8803]
MPIPLQDTTERLPTFTAYLLSRRITFITIPELIKVIRRTCLEGKKMIVASYNINSFNLSMHLPWFYDFLQSAEIARCDGFGILKAFQYMGLSLSQKYRASGTVLVPSLLEQLKSEDFSFFLLGSKPQYIEKALTRIREQYPTLRVEGHHGYFDKEDYYQNEAVVQYINRVKPNILIVGMGMPTQERWIQRHRHLLDVNVILPSGAVIDRLAGIVPDCPKVISDIGCEWLYRLCREPRRLAARYLIGNFAFGLQVALAKHSHTSSLHVEQKEIIGSQSF